MAETNRKNIEQQESLLEKQQESADRAAAMEAVDSSSDVADILEGVAMGEISEKASEKKEGDSSTTAKKKAVQKQDNTTQTSTIPKHRPLPSTNVMRRSVVKTLKKEEHGLVKEAQKLEKKPFEYAEKIKEVRGLRQKIADFLQAKLQSIKETYLKYFGKKHGVEEEKDA